MSVRELARATNGFYQRCTAARRRGTSAFACSLALLYALSILTRGTSSQDISDPERISASEVELAPIVEHKPKPWYQWFFWIFPRFALRRYIFFVIFLACGLAVFVPLAITKFHCSYQGWATGILLIIQVSWLACDVSPTHFVTLTMVRASDPPPPSSVDEQLLIHRSRCYLVMCAGGLYLSINQSQSDGRLDVIPSVTAGRGAGWLQQHDAAHDRRRADHHGQHRSLALSAVHLAIPLGPSLVVHRRCVVAATPHSLTSGGRY